MNEELDLLRKLEQAIRAHIDKFDSDAAFVVVVDLLMALAILRHEAP
jgi:hypothetical protein